MTVVDQLVVDEPKTSQAVELLAQLDVEGRALLVDARSEEHLRRAVQNLSQVRVVDSNRVTARDVAAAARILMTPAAVEHLGKVLAT